MRIDDDLDAYTIKAFCDRHSISQSMYFKLKQRGEGPREMKLGARVLISREAANEWRRQREADGAVETA